MRLYSLRVHIKFKKKVKKKKFCFFFKIFFLFFVFFFKFFFFIFFADLSNSSFVQFQVWDFPGQIDFFDPTFDGESIFGQCGKEKKKKI